MSSPELLPAEEFGHARLSAPSESQSGSDAEPPVMPNATGRSVLIRRGPRLEQRDDVKVSTLRRYVRALGAELELVVVLKTGHKMRLDV